MAAFERMLIYLFNQELNNNCSFDEMTSSKISSVDSEDIIAVLGLEADLKDCVLYIMKFCHENNIYISDWKDLRAVCNYIMDNNYISASLYDSLNHILLKIGVAEYFGVYLIHNYHGQGLKNITGVADRGRTFANISDGEEFELYCVSLLELNGFKNVSLTPVIGDHGVDIIAEKDNIKYAIQCKYYSVPVGNNAVQEVFTGRAFYKCDIAIVMTNSTYTRQAIEEATALGVKLWDGDYLQDLKQLHASKL